MSYIRGIIVRREGEPGNEAICAQPSTIYKSVVYRDTRYLPHLHYSASKRKRIILITLELNTKQKLI